MTIEEFKILRFLYENTSENLTQRDISLNIDLSLGATNSILIDLISTNFIDKNYRLTKIGQDALEPYKVKNAIILAAGMSTRFAPISFEKPKGLISVKGEVMVERLIRQLQDAGISEIIIVVGYMMDKFFYLREKYGVKLVVNNEFATKNTHSSIYVARDYLSNTYICCSDNYYPKNMFHHYEYRAFYCSIYLPGTSYVERAFTYDKTGLIIDTNKPSKDQWIMYGHAYYDNTFTSAFKPILENYYGRSGVENMYWENVYAENVKVLQMWINKCTPSDILEFDSMEELKEFDPEFISHNRIKIFDNIEKVLNCKISDIKDIETVKKGLNNRSFKFLCKGEYYIYRHPGVNASSIIDRHKETVSLSIAKKLGVDETLLFINEDEGWKISKYMEPKSEFDFNNQNHLKLLAQKLKTLHDSKISVGFGFDYQKEAERLIKYIKIFDAYEYQTLSEIRNEMNSIFSFLDSDKWQVSLCHNDIYEPNILVLDNKIEIIDWEFAGDSDIGFDICKLFALVKPEYKNIDNYLSFYFQRQTTDSERKHLIACSAIIYYYWYIWGLYVSKNGNQASEYLIPWYDKMVYYKEMYKTLK